MDKQLFYVLYCIVLYCMGQLTCRIQAVNHCISLLYDSYVLTMTVSDNYLDQHAPHRLESRVPAVIVLTLASRFVYP